MIAMNWTPVLSLNDCCESCRWRLALLHAIIEHRSFTSCHNRPDLQDNSHDSFIARSIALG